VKDLGKFGLRGFAVGKGGGEEEDEEGGRAGEGEEVGE
jgi:hypothetical protein